MRRIDERLTVAGRAGREPRRQGRPPLVVETRVDYGDRVEGRVSLGSGGRAREKRRRPPRLGEIVGRFEERATERVGTRQLRPPARPEVLAEEPSDRRKRGVDVAGPDLDGEPVESEIVPPPGVYSDVDVAETELGQRFDQAYEGALTRLGSIRLSPWGPRGGVTL